MTRTMYDAVTAANITKANPNPQLVAGYIDKIKLEPWSAADWARFPNARKVTIVKKASTNDGHVLDVEPGDATPEQAPGWAARRRASGFAYPVIYCNRSTWPKVKAAFAAQNVAPPLYWIATASGRPEIPDGAIAAQYLLDYQGVDVSVVADYWPGVDGPGKEDDMFTPDDFAKLMWGNVFDTNGNRNFAAFLKDMDAKVTALAAKAGGASAEEIAAKLLPALTTALVAEVAKVDAISDADAEQIAEAVTARAGVLLGGGQ